MLELRKPNLAQYARETILSAEQCSDWLGMSIDSMERADIPCAFLGTRTRRYVVGEVLDFLSRKMRRAS